MSIVRKDLDDMLNDLKSQPQLKTPLDKELYLMEKYEEFYATYPFLLKKLTKIYNDPENLAILYLLVEKMDNINTGKEDKTTVEDQLGQQLAKKYLP